MTTTEATYALFRSLSADRLRAEIAYVEKKIAKLAKRKSPKLHDDYSAFMSPTLAIMREILAEKAI